MIVAAMSTYVPIHHPIVSSQICDSYILNPWFLGSVKPEVLEQSWTLRVHFSNKKRDNQFVFFLFDDWDISNYLFIVVIA